MSVDDATINGVSEHGGVDLQGAVSDDVISGEHVTSVSD